MLKVLAPDNPTHGGDADFRRDLVACVEALPEHARHSGRRLWSSLANAGLVTPLYLPAPHRHHSPVIAPRLRTLIETLDAHCPIGAVLSVCVQAASAVPLLLQHAPHQRTAVLDGTTTVALAVNDSAISGTSITAMRTTVERTRGDSVVVDGAKAWITNATTADYLLVLARNPKKARSFSSLTWIRIPTNHPGVSIHAADTSFSSGAGLGHCSLDHVTLSGDHVIGGIGRGMPIFTTHITMERWSSVWWSLSMARRILTQTRQRLDDRDTGGQALWSHQAIQHRFAECLLQFQLTQALANQGFTEGDTGTATNAMLAKVTSGRMLTAVLQECAQLHGADGFTMGGIQALRSEAAMFTLAGGAVESLLLAVAADAQRLLRDPRQP